MNESFFKKLYLPGVTPFEGIAKCCTQRLNWTTDFRIQNNRNSLDFFGSHMQNVSKKYVVPKYWFSQDPKLKKYRDFIKNYFQFLGFTRHVGEQIWKLRGPHGKPLAIGEWATTYFKPCKQNCHLVLF